LSRQEENVSLQNDLCELPYKRNINSEISVLSKGMNSTLLQHAYTLDSYPVGVMMIYPAECSYQIIFTPLMEWCNAETPLIYVHWKRQTEKLRLRKETQFM